MTHMFEIDIHDKKACTIRDRQNIPTDAYCIGNGYYVQYPHYVTFRIREEMNDTDHRIGEVIHDLDILYRYRYFNSINPALKKILGKYLSDIEAISVQAAIFHAYDSFEYAIYFFIKSNNKYINLFMPDVIMNRGYEAFLVSRERLRLLMISIREKVSIYNSIYMGFEPFDKDKEIILSEYECRSLFCPDHRQCPFSHIRYNRMAESYRVSSNNFTSCRHCDNYET